MKGRLAPSGTQFLPELVTIAELAVAAAEVLRDSVESGIDRASMTADIAAHVHEADRLANAVMVAATHALVPPIDADDATDLAWRLRTVVHAVGRVSEGTNSLRPLLPDVSVSCLIGLLVAATDSLEGAAITLTDRSRAIDFAREVRRMDHEGDHAYTEAMGALLTATGDPLPATGDPLPAVRQAEFYRTLRESLRACARAAVSAEHIALKRFPT